MFNKSNLLLVGLIVGICGLFIQFLAEVTKAIFFYSLHLFILGYLVMTIGAFMTFIGGFTAKEPTNRQK